MEKTSNRFYGVPVALNALHEDSGILRVSGYCCHFGKANHNGEVVVADSFSKWLEHLSESDMRLPLNYNHDSDRQIGGIDSLKADDKGLWMEAHINTEVAFVRDELLPLIKGGDLSYLSTEGFISNVKGNDDGSYTVGCFALTAVALVALPADFSAKPTINSAKPKEGAKFRKLIF